MPIATVRIAPVERWCGVLEQFPAPVDPEILVGATVQIDTGTMSRSVWCDGHCWQQPLESSNWVREKMGLEPHDYYHRLCEHMLEMD